MPTVAVIGPGAIGCVLASYLLKNPRNALQICARSAFETLNVDYEGKKTLHHPAVYTSPRELHPVDWIVLATKTYQVEQASKWFPPLSHERTALAVVQNGVEHLANLEPFFDRNRIVPVIIDCPAQRQSQGEILQFGDVLMQVPKSPLSQDFADLFDNPEISITQTNDWITAAWAKLAINCPGAICALVDQPANIAGDPRAKFVMENLIRECICVGKAEGADLDDSMIEEIIAKQARAPEGSMNSLHADFAARRPMEWEARNGVVVRRGKAHDIPTPFNQMAASLLSLLETSR